MLGCFVALGTLDSFLFPTKRTKGEEAKLHYLEELTVIQLTYSLQVKCALFLLAELSDTGPLSFSALR